MASVATRSTEPLPLMTLPPLEAAIVEHLASELDPPRRMLAAPACAGARP